MFKVWRLKWQRWATEGHFEKQRRKLMKENASREDIGHLEAEEYFHVRDIDDQIDWEVGRHLVDVARSLDVEVPLHSDREMWKAEEHSNRICLTSKGRAQVRRLIDEEKARRFDVKTRWVLKIILPPMAALVGLIGALTGLISVLRH